MNGYINIKANEIPFYISLAKDGMEKHHEFGNINNLTNIGYEYCNIYNMLIESKGRDIYIDFDSFCLLEKMKTNN